MQMQIQEKHGASVMIFGKEKFKLEALKEAKGALKGTVFQYITIKYIHPKYCTLYPAYFSKRSWDNCTTNIATTQKRGTEIGGKQNYIKKKNAQNHTKLDQVNECS